MTRKKIILVTVVFFIFFILISLFRYQQVNGEYSNYKVTEKNVTTNETFEFLKISHTFRKAKKINTIDEMRNKVTEYRIPIELKNTTKDKLTLHPEFYRMMRGEEETETIDFIDNKTGEKISDLKPYQLLNGTVTFTFLNNSESKYQPVDLHIIGSDGVSVQKFIVKVY
ncbi:hypothetical protein NNG64_19755 [Bacillus siamensis]|uniref:DUF4352 domain-containing protein n=1 Tax=Bacillus siamensis TaxID=659243 RepID=A0AAI8HK10_9BACI|nr:MULTISPECIES: hypothetical protein [Bacillus]AME06796.1 hypothetical protein AUL54_10905 [Bacillus sp. SDLI1]AUJ75375.1 hypothetical protein CWD84_00295 [Bacillus siamensis]UUA84251.1 hypothetical protein NNG64_19755 [Bacillus siamensis]